MKKEDHRRLLEQAAMATMERIRRDREKAPGKLKHLFSYLEENIFDRNLDVTRMRRACGVRDNSLSIYFTEATGRAPRTYIAELRVETAAALIRDTDLRMWIISNLTGFSHQVVLNRNFKRFFEMTPMAFRLGARKIIAKGHSPTIGTPSVAELRKAIAHEQKATSELFMHIRYPNSSECADRETQSDLFFEKLAFPENAIEAIKVEEAWEFLKEKPWVEQRTIIHDRIVFPTPILFHYLREKSIPEGRDNRKLGVHLAELAMHSLGITEYISGKELLNLRAQGWIWLGNARRLADDLNGAEAAFSIAASYLEQEKEDSQVQAEYYSMKTSLRLWQRRIAEATELNRRALSMLRAIGNPRDIGTSLIIGGYLYYRAGKDEESIAYSEEALKHLNGQTEPYLEFAATYNLTTAYVKTGALEKAKGMLPRLRELIEIAHAGAASAHFLQWLESQIADASNEFILAAGLYHAARAGFLKLDQNIEAALVSLDLALLNWRHGRLGEVRELTLKVIPLLEAIQYHEEAAAGMKMLQSAIEKDALTRTVLEKTREYLENIRLDPWT
ncbi:MAG: helix-turn-helix domain-containing protein [Deltaproteobacteria bacterium]|nr:helix-turn-helix domain-containing protein [Deltaproteobacteria bacterium]